MPRIVRVVCSLIALLLAWGSYQDRGPSAREAPEEASIAIDRWLVSTAFAVDSAGDPLEREHLLPPGEAGVLPDRGGESAGAAWRLVRRDSADTFFLEDSIARSEGPVVAYAHAYIRAPEDRTVRLTWGGIECTRATAWLNGRSLSALVSGDTAAAAAEPALGSAPATSVAPAAAAGAHSARVRLGRGWNTLLLKVASGPCPLGLRARLGADAAGSLEGVRVQASRPPGDVRTGPDPWILTSADAGPDASLGWNDDQLLGALRIGVTAWARVPVDSAILEARVGGIEVRETARWLVPAAPQTVRMPVQFDRLRRAALDRDGARVSLRWGDRDDKRSLPVDAERLLNAFHSPISMIGWRAIERGDGSAEADGDGRGADTGGTERAGATAAQDRDAMLPRSGGWLVAGEWRVPEPLAGFMLAIDVSRSPGAFRVNARSVEARDGEIRLCGPCEQGASFHLDARSARAWGSLPTVRVVDPGYPLARDAPGSPPPAEWLRLLDGKKSRTYRELAEKLMRQLGSTPSAAGSREGSI